MPDPVKQPFYTSKSFWLMFLGIVFTALQYFGIVDATKATEITNMVMFVLGMIFRWVADQPLSLPGPDVKKLN